MEQLIQAGKGKLLGLMNKRIERKQAGLNQPAFFIAQRYPKYSSLNRFF